MSSVKEVPLGTLIKPAKVVKAGSGTYPILSMTMHQGLVDQNQKFKKTVASKDLSGYKVVRRGQLVVSFPIDEGVLDFQQLYDEAIVSPAYGIWDLIEGAEVDINYLGFMLRSERSLAYYRSKLQGSTARRRSLPRDVFLALPIELPDLEEQKRFVQEKELLSIIQEKREHQQELLVELELSIYDQLFGAQGTHLMGATHKKFSEVIKLSSGSFLPASKQDGGIYPVYGGNGKNGQHSKYNQDSSKVIIGRVGANCGSIHITEEKCWVTDNALVTFFNREVFVNEFLAFMLKQMRLNQYSNKSGQPSISANSLKDLNLIIPTIENQKKFSTVLKDIHRLDTRF